MSSGPALGISLGPLTGKRPLVLLLGGVLLVLPGVVTGVPLFGWVSFVFWSSLVLDEGSSG